MPDEGGPFPNGVVPLQRYMVAVGGPALALDSDDSAALAAICIDGGNESAHWHLPLANYDRHAVRHQLAQHRK